MKKKVTAKENKIKYWADCGLVFIICYQNVLVIFHLNPLNTEQLMMRHNFRFSRPAVVTKMMKQHFLNVPKPPDSPAHL